MRIPSLPQKERKSFLSKFVISQVYRILQMFLKTTISSFFLVRVRSGIDDKFINYDNYSDDVTYDAVDAIVEVLGRLREKNKEWEGQLTFQNTPPPRKKNRLTPKQERKVSI